MYVCMYDLLTRVVLGAPLPPVAESRHLSPEIKTVQKTTVFQKIDFVEKILDMYLLLDLSSLLVNIASFF